MKIMNAFMETVMAQKHLIDLPIKGESPSDYLEARQARKRNANIFLRGYVAGLVATNQINTETRENMLMLIDTFF